MVFIVLKIPLCLCSLQIPPQQPMANFGDKIKDKAIDLQNFGLRSDLYNKKNTKVSKQPVKTP